MLGIGISSGKGVGKRKAGKRYKTPKIPDSRALFRLPSSFGIRGCRKYDIEEAGIGESIASGGENRPKNAYNRAVLRFAFPPTVSLGRRGRRRPISRRISGKR